MISFFLIFFFFKIVSLCICLHIKHSLADEALSWEGTASYASENSKESPIKKEEATGGGGGGGGGSRGEESSYDVSPPSSPSSSSWRSEVKQLFNGEEEYYNRK